MDFKKARYNLAHASESGFALPVAIGMGLIMLLLGVTMIVRSHGDRVNATSQTANAQSLAAAEAGVSKLRTFLNRYRILAAYPSSGTDSWSNPGSIPASLLYADCSTMPGDVQTSLDQHSPSGSDWPDVVTGDPAQGEYRLVGYTYNQTPGIFNTSSVGQLTVQGRVNAGQPNEAVSQLLVELPVTVRQGKIPAIWVSSTGAVQNNPTVAADVLGACTTTLDVDATPVATVTASGVNIPPPPAKPVSNIVDLGATLPAVLPQPADVTSSANLNGNAYQYSISALNGPVTVAVGANQEVHLWVDGDINLEDQIVRQNCSGTPGCMTTKVRIFGTNVAGNTITLNEGSVVCDILFHAPSYTVTFNAGGTATTDCAGNPLVGGLQTNSAYWIEAWNGATHSVTLAPPTATWQDMSNAEIPPQLSPVARWEAQSVN